MNWTYEEGLRFECARDFLTDMMGVCSASIAEEMLKPLPDREIIEALRETRFNLSLRLNSLHVRDHKEITNILSQPEFLGI